MVNKNELKVFKNCNGEIVCNSVVLANDFGKRHYDVMVKIGKLEDNEKIRSRKWFIRSTYRNEQNKELECYELTKDGFMFLVTGFTGKKAEDIKLQYIQEYSDMEQYILQSKQREEFEYFRKTGKVIRRGLTDKIKETNPKGGFVYGLYTNIIYEKIFGKKAKELKEEKGLKTNQQLRDSFTSNELAMVKDLEEKVKSVIDFYIMNGTNPKRIVYVVEDFIKNIKI